MAVILHAVPLAGVCRKERSSPVPQVRARPEEMRCVGSKRTPLPGAAPRHMLSVEYLPVCYRYFDCFDSFSGWYGMVVLHVVFDSLIFVRHLIV